MPKVSVIIPNYNHASYLEQRINSVLNQTFKDFEVIILDDCSSDNSRKIIERYRNHAKVSCISYNQKNSGSTFKQWNKGIKLANGDLIWLAESDDDASEFFLEEMVAKFYNFKNLGIVYCDSYYIDEKNEKSKCTHLWKNKQFASDRWLSDFKNLGIDEVNNYLIYHNVIDNASSALFKKEFLLKAGLADETFRYAGDLLLYMKVLMFSDIAYVSKPLNYFRDHSINTTKQSYKNGLSYLERVLSYTQIIRNNDLIDKEVRKRKYRESIKDYGYFLSVNTKGSKNIRMLINGQLRLMKSNFRYSLLLLLGVFKVKLQELVN